MLDSLTKKYFSPLTTWWMLIGFQIVDSYTLGVFLNILFGILVGLFGLLINDILRHYFVTKT